MAVRDRGQARRPWIMHRTLTPPSSFVSVLELKAFERFPVAPQTLEFNSLESTVECKGEGTGGGYKMGPVISSVRVALSHCNLKG